VLLQTHLKKLHSDGSVFVAKHSGYANQAVVVKSFRKPRFNACYASSTWMTEFKAYEALGLSVNRVFLCAGWFCDTC
jgi:hypothetical protein